LSHVEAVNGFVPFWPHLMTCPCGRVVCGSAGQD